MQSGGGAIARLLAVLALTFLVAACGGRAGSLPALPAVDEGPYRLGAGDRIRLVVFGQDDAPALLGAYTLEGLRLAVDPTHGRLIPAPHAWA